MINFSSHNDQGRIIWDTASLDSELQAQGISNNRKATDRWLEQQQILPATVELDELRDEQGKALKPQVVEHLLSIAKRSVKTYSSFKALNMTVTLACLPMTPKAAVAGYGTTLRGPQTALRTLWLLWLTTMVKTPSSSLMAPSALWCAISG